MRVNWLKRTAWILGLALVLGGLVWFAWPRPVAVDLATVTRGKLSVTVDDEGKTRAAAHTVSAPIAGSAENFPSF
jgi:HlyD family secretion protein